MNYKKMTFRASMLGLIVMLFAGLVSCSSDDDDKNIPSRKGSMLFGKRS